MFYRNAKILANESLSASGTKVIDITLQDIISRISLDIYGVNNGTTHTAHPAEMVSTIELVDGSDVLFSLSGAEALALDYYQSRRSPFVINNYQDDEYCRCIYNLNFGRKLYDKLLALDPAKFRNLQLKVTYDRDGGGSSPDEGGICVVADVFDQKAIAPIGFISPKEIVSYTMAASANEYIDMPVDLNMRSVMLLCKDSDGGTPIKYNEIKLSEDNDKRIPYNEYKSRLLKIFGGNLPPIQEHFVMAGSASAKTVYCMSSYEGQISVVQRDGTEDSYLATQPADGKVNITGGETGTIHGIIQGYAPFGSLLLPFGDPQDVEDWFDLSATGSLRMTIKASSTADSTNTCQVVTEQIRPYAA
jgi:hypothetical protein